MKRLTFKTPAGALEYTITRRPRVTKRLHMELDEQGNLVVVAPGHWSRGHIKATLAQNFSRVERFMVRARQKHRAPLLYAHGEKHLYMGELYPLTVLHVKTGQECITVSDGKIHINTAILQSEKVQTQLQNWYRQQASTVFTARLQIMAQRAPWARDKKIQLKLRRMKRTWGNCSSGGVIKLNTHLVKAPLQVLDSVIAHELCHLEEMNHGSAFYALLEILNPNWKQDRARLRSEGFTYLLT